MKKLVFPEACSNAPELGERKSKAAATSASSRRGLLFCGARFVFPSACFLNFEAAFLFLRPPLLHSRERLLYRGRRLLHSGARFVDSRGELLDSGAASNSNFGPNQRNRGCADTARRLNRIV